MYSKKGIYRIMAEWLFGAEDWIKNQKSAPWFFSTLFGT
jgi:hypothetical protein